MISVFGSFVLNGDPTIKQFGVGLSVAVLLARAMVLSLAPAMLTLFGTPSGGCRAGWPRVLRHVDIEGGVRNSTRPASRPRRRNPESAGPAEQPTDRRCSALGLHVGHRPVARVAPALRMVSCSSTYQPS
jgi:uncharacterized membrane protein YdfJ with MMPL/SSD domain